MREHDGIEIFTAEERPDLWERARSLFTTEWPEYNMHGNHTGTYFRELYPKHARFQILLYDTAGDSVVGRGGTIPFRWDGTLEDLPAGMDALGARAITDPAPPTALSALAAEVASDRQRTGLSSVIIESMAAAARAGGLTPLVAPVRPSWKDRYPLTPIERYASWVRPDGLPFDPWLRVHVRLGATLLRTAPKSLEIVAPVSDWQEWTGMEFPEDGEYVFPAGLAPLTVRQGIGSYWEPNIWMRHEV